MRLADPHRARTECQELKNWHHARWVLLLEILEEVDRIESGKESLANLTQKADFLGADGPPSVGRSHA
jgi:hypothetical protein